MSRNLYVSVAMLFFCQLIFGQHPILLPNSAGKSGTGANIDVVYHRIWWRINPDSASKGIKGTVTTYFTTTTANVSVIT